VPSYFAKLCITFTAMAPALGAAAIISVSAHDSWEWGIAFGVAAVLSVFITVLVLGFVQKYSPKETLHCTEINHADQKVLEFLLAYVLPLFSATSLDSKTGATVLTIYSLIVVILTVVHGNIFLFNPVLALLGYHFYEAKDRHGIKYVLITKKAYHKAERDVVCKKLGEYLRLEAK
jgi:MFS family permease